MSTRLVWDQVTGWLWQAV